MAGCELLLDSVSYRYPGGHLAVSDLSLDLRPGILGLLGPEWRRQVDADAHPRHAGAAERGQDHLERRSISPPNPMRLRTALGYLPQDFGVYSALSAREFLAFLAAVKGLSGARRASASRAA